MNEKITLWKAFQMWRAYCKTKQSLQEAKMKSGWKTTEFWGAILAAIIPVVNKYMGIELDVNTLMVIYAPLTAYIVNRMVVKAKNGGVKPSSSEYRVTEPPPIQ